MPQVDILVVGAGHMGRSHARAYHTLGGFNIKGVMTRTDSGAAIAAKLGVPHYIDFAEAMSVAQPQAVSINTYTDSHFDYVTASLRADCHVFIEKPLAETVAQCDDIDLTEHMSDARSSLAIVLAADESIRTKQVVTL